MQRWETQWVGGRRELKHCEHAGLETLTSETSFLKRLELGPNAVQDWRARSQDPALSGQGALDCLSLVVGQVHRKDAIRRSAISPAGARAPTSDLKAQSPCPEALDSYIPLA